MTNFMAKAAKGIRRLLGSGGVTARRWAAPVALGLLTSLSTVDAAPRMPTYAVTAAAPDRGAASLRIQPSAMAQMAVLKQIKASKTKMQNKIDSRLWMGLLNSRRDTRAASLPNFRFVRPEKTDGRVAVDVLIGKGNDVGPVWKQLETLGAVVATDKRVAWGSHSIRARVKLGDLETLASLAQVSKVRRATGAFTNAAPAFRPTTTNNLGAFTNALTTSQGVAAHGADVAQSFYGAKGAGQTICVLSDGAQAVAASQASGDLPAGNQVFVLPGQVGSGNEGTAMMEIIYDMAPAARIGFATAFTSEASFAQNILDLATAGCTIIADDVIYLDESPWQDGPVAQAVNTVTANGVLYFSSAGNEGNKTDGTSGTWEGDYKASLAAVPPVLQSSGVTHLHDFGDGGNSILVTGGDDSTPAVLIWAENYDLSTGGASTDFDLYDMDGALTTVFDASFDNQDGTGGDDFPIESIDGGAFTGDRLVIDKFTEGTTSSVPAINLILFRGTLDPALATNGATRGHSAALNAFSTAATPAGPAAYSTPPAVGPFPNQFSSGNSSEVFSSDGTRRLVLAPDGSELTPGNRTYTGGVVRQKPDITAADGVSTSAPGFATFFGTSAAAPHAAAIAGIIKSALPALTQPQLRNLLTSTAIDIEAPGVDNTTGAGIVMPVPALQAGGAAPQAFLTAGTATYTQVVGDGDGVIEPNETFSISLPLTNTGGASTGPNVSVTLSTASPNVTILNGTASYPSISAGNTVTVLAAFTFSVQQAFGCGLPISFSATASYTGVNSPQTLALAATPTGGTGAPVSFSYAGAPVPIPDAPGPDVGGTNANAPVVVSGVGGIKDVNLSIDGTSCSATAGSTTVGIDHTFINDLQIRLISPDNTVVQVINRTDGGGNNLCQTVLDDESAGPSIQSVVSSQAPFTGSFKPASPLSAFDGKTANGTWQLQAQDFFAADSGNIRAFTVTIAPAICDAPVPNADSTPNPFSFTAVSGVNPSTVQTSNAVTVGGINVPSPISVAGGTYSIDGGAYTSVSGTVSNGQQVTVRQTASASYKTTTTTTLTIGGINGAYKVTTREGKSTPGPFTFTPVKPAELNTVYTSNQVTITGLEVPGSAKVSGGSFSINNGAFTTSAVTLNNGDTVRMRVTSSSSFNKTVSATFKMGGTERSFDVTTKKQ